MAERKSIYHGLTSNGHGPDEHGLGGLESPEDPRDFAIADHPGYAAALATAFPAAWLEPNTPPISNQGATPQCVAYSAANDQGHMDRPESGHDFENISFFLIGRPGRTWGDFCRDPAIGASSKLQTGSIL